MNSFSASLQLSGFVREFNALLLLEKAKVELSQVLSQIVCLQSMDPSIEMNGFLNEKIYDDLYDLTE